MLFGMAVQVFFIPRKVSQKSGWPAWDDRRPGDISGYEYIHLIRRGVPDFSYQTDQVSGFYPSWFEQIKWVGGGGFVFSALLALDSLCLFVKRKKKEKGGEGDGKKKDGKYLP